MCSYKLYPKNNTDLQQKVPEAHWGKVAPVIIYRRVIKDKSLDSWLSLVHLLLLSISMSIVCNYPERYTVAKKKMYEHFSQMQLQQWYTG